MTVLGLSVFTAGLLSQYSDAGGAGGGGWGGGDSDLRRGISGAGRRDRRWLAQEVSIEVGLVWSFIGGSFFRGRLVGAGLLL